MSSRRRLLRFGSFFFVLVIMSMSTTTTEGAIDKNCHPEPNPPHWPSSTVKIIRPTMTTDEIRKIIEPTEDTKEVYKDIYDNDHVRIGYNTNRHFVTERYALLFAPGIYKQLDIEVGYYVQLAGLGKRADDVVFTECDRGPFVEALNKKEKIGNALGLSLDTFWRIGENFKTEAKYGMLWAVSQASPLRRVHVGGNLILHDKGAYASGGILANAIVEGHVDFGSQQQWLSRSVDFRNGGSNNDNTMEQQPMNLGAWSMVFVDCKGRPPSSSDNTDGGQGDGDDDDGPLISVDDTPRVTVEKPYVVMKDDNETYELCVPKPRLLSDGQTQPNGPDLVGTNDDCRDFSEVKVGISTVQDEHDNDIPDLDVTTKLQTALDEGKDLVLSPGLYFLTKTLLIRRSDQVVLGLGLATLIAPPDGSPCIRVAPHAKGVRIASIMLEATDIHRTWNNPVATLLEWGTVDVTDKGDATNPGVLTDIFARVGGSSLSRTVWTDIMIRIHSDNVYGDNIWLWRADHVKLHDNEEEVPNYPGISKKFHQTVNGECPVRVGLEVNGNDVTIHGLAVEHMMEHQTLWNGDRGNVQFYQCEFPYDVTSNFGDANYVGYKVHDTVVDHIANGLGIYSNFRDHVVFVKTAIQHPNNKMGGTIQIDNMFTVRLDNNGLIQSVVNGLGKPADKQGIPSRY